MNKTLLPALMLLGSSTAFAQGGPNCSSAVPIQGAGVWSWFGGGPVAQSEFSPGTDCTFRPGHIENYFQWTATSAGSYQFDTLGSTWDTQLAVYAGNGCNAACAAYDYGTGSIPLGSYLSFLNQSVLVVPNVNAGDTFLVRVGNLPESHTPWVSLGISPYTDPCLGETDDALEDNDRYWNAVPVGNGTHPGLWASYLDPDYYQFCVDPGATLQVDLLFPHAAGNINARLYEVPVLFADDFGQPVVYGNSQTDNETLVVTNTGNSNRNYRLAVFVNGAQPGSDCNTYDLVVSGAGACAFTSSTFCDPMDANSTGLPTLLRAEPSSAVASGLRLEASQGPPGQFAYFLVGSGFSEPGLALGEGRFCLAVTNFERFGRYNLTGTPSDSVGRFQPNGELANISGTSSTGFGFEVPTELPFLWWFDRAVTLNAGQTWYFQLWHRENNGQSNFSNGVRVNF